MAITPREDAKMFRRILVPLDGSKAAEGVLPFVTVEAQCHDATVLLVRVIAPFRSSLMLIPGLLEQADAQVMTIVEDYLENIADQLQREGIDVEVIIDHGPPAQRILELAESEDCDLIIIGTHGETGGIRWRFGAVANKIIKAKTDIPVMVVTT
jgi:nucleotide-binding universal stress UspA family protein